MKGKLIIPVVVGAIKKKLIWATVEKDRII